MKGVTRRSLEEANRIVGKVSVATARSLDAARHDGYLTALVQMESAVLAGEDPYRWLNQALAAAQ